MRIILSENRFNSLFSDWLERSGINIEFQSMPGYLNGYDERIVTGCLNFSKRGNNFGLRNFYVYKFRVGEDNELQFYESNGRPERLREFKMFPPEVVRDYLIELSRKHQEQRLKK